MDAKMAARIKQIDTEKKRKGWNLFKKKVAKTIIAYQMVSYCSFRNQLSNYFRKYFYGITIIHLGTYISFF